MTTIDPAEGLTFFQANEYYATTSSFNWHTRIGKFKFPTPRLLGHQGLGQRLRRAHRDNGSTAPAPSRKAAALMVARAPTHRTRHRITKSREAHAAYRFP